MAKPINNAHIFRGSPEQQTILAANGHIVRTSGKVFRITAVRLGRSIMAAAEEAGKGNKPINLFAKEGAAIRAIVETGSFS